MRVLRYELKLSEFGYMITSGNVITDDNIVEERTTLPIKVTIPEGHEHQFDRSVSELVYDKKKIPEFGDYYREFLLNQNPDWYLYSCEVTARSLVLGYYCSKKHEHGSIVFDNVSRPIKFQLAVPRRDNKPDSAYDVHLLAVSNELKDSKIKRYEAKVIEYHENGYRKLTFLDENCRGYNADKYVYVDEYVDL